MIALTLNSRIDRHNLGYYISTHNVDTIRQIFNKNNSFVFSEEVIETMYKVYRKSKKLERLIGDSRYRAEREEERTAAICVSSENIRMCNYNNRYAAGVITGTLLFGC